jgi:hypothetical protein
MAPSAFKYDDLIRTCPASKPLGIILAGTFTENLSCPSNVSIELGTRMTIDHTQKILIAELLHFLRNLLIHRGGRCITARRISEDKGIVKSYGVRELASLLVFSVALSGKTHDDVGGNSEAGPRLAKSLHKPQIPFRGVSATHYLENAVGAALQGEVDMFDEFLLASQGAKEVVTKSNWVWGGKADARDSIHGTDAIDELDERAQSFAFLEFMTSLEVNDLTE